MRQEGGDWVKTITIKASKKPKIISEVVGKSAQDAVREAFETASGKMTVIPARRNAHGSDNPRKLRVCAYCRVSTGSEEQASSYEMQYQYYTELRQANEEWEFSGIYADEGTS